MINPDTYFGGAKVVFAPKNNKPFRKDAAEFRSEASKFFEAYPGTGSVTVIDNGMSELLQEGQVIDALKHLEGTSFDVAFFCHGFKNRIQFGFRGPNGARRLAARISKGRTGPGVLRCMFYCCSVAADEDNWFNWFCDELERLGCLYWAVGHSTSGHTTKNPYVKYRGSTRSYSGAAYLVRPGCPKWPDWVTSLKTEHRFFYPYETISDTTEQLGGM